MEQPKLVRRFSITKTLRLMEIGQTLFLTYRQCAPEVVYNAALRLKRNGEGLYEVHRSAGDSTITRLR